MFQRKKISPIEVKSSASKTNIHRAKKRNDNDFIVKPEIISF